MKTTLHIDEQTYELNRFPLRSNETLQAWNASDEYVLNHIFTSELKPKRILIVNDSFGAVSVALHKFRRTVWTDSYTSHQSIYKNHEQNFLDTETLPVLPMGNKDEEQYDLVLIKIPKTHTLLEYQLTLLQQNIHAETKIIGFGMTKHIHTSTLNYFSELIGKTQTSLAQKKARLVFSEVEEKQYSAILPHSFQLEDYPLNIVHYPNVFSSGKLDVGTRVLLPFIPKGESLRIADLGCGSGVIAAIAMFLNPKSEVVGLDDSYLAVKSSEQTFTENQFKGEFYPSNSFDGYEGEAFDLILCNPPFHQEFAITDHIAWRMFSQSYHQLKVGGCLRIVANRHLNYHQKLKRIFGNCETVSSHSKFVILQSFR